MKKFTLLALILAQLAFSAESHKIRVGLVLDKGGKDDKSFNAAAYKGATEMEKKLGIFVKTVESSDDTSFEPNLRTFAQHGFDLIIAIGFAQREAVQKVAPDFPKQHFLLIDSEVDLPNVRTVMFGEHEGGYLAGSIAAMSSRTGTIGFVGGMDVPLIHRFEMGYRAGAKATNPKITVITNYVGSSSDSWRNPTKGKELALSQYHKNADVIFAAAGASGLGVFDAAEEQKKLVIGVDSNQDWIKPGRVLTSIEKKVDRAVADVIQMESDGKFQSGKFQLGIAAGGIDYSIDQYNRSLISKDYESKMTNIKKQISEKKIQVPDYYETGKKKSASR